MDVFDELADLKGAGEVAKGYGIGSEAGLGQVSAGIEV